MTEPNGVGGVPEDSGDPSVSPAFDSLAGTSEEGLAPNEAFGALASEVRIAVLVALYAAERDDEDPLPFSALHRASGADTSAGFAYHLRQLDGHFVRGGDDGYRLTPAGRRAAELVVAGTLTDADGPNRAS